MWNGLRRVALGAAIGFSICGTLPAANQISWVASYGNDSNACTRALPCRTFGGAYANTNATGAIHVIDAADYGFLDINKSMTLDGGGKGAVIYSPGEQASIRINSGNSDRITIRNLEIYPESSSDSYHGIMAGLNGTTVLDIENVTIHIPSANAYGMSLSLGANAPAGSKPLVNLRNVRVTGGHYGILVNGPSVTAERASVSFAQIGVRLYAGNMTVRDSVIQANSNTGFDANYPSTALLERTDISFNGTGVTPNFGSLIRLADCVIFGNTTGIGTGQGSIVSFRTNMLAGNTTDGTLPLTTSLK